MAKVEQYYGPDPSAMGHPCVVTLLEAIHKMVPVAEEAVSAGLEGRMFDMMTAATDLQMKLRQLASEYPLPNEEGGNT